MQSQLGDTTYFHRFVRWYAALQGLLALALVLAASSASAVMTDSPRDIIMHGLASLVRTVFSWLKSSPAVA
jgi:hypothetical protein